jgi:transcriptional regulator with PAS, ATPase and Fis domain
MCDAPKIGPSDIRLPTEGENELPAQQGKTLKEYTADIIRYYLRQHDNNVQTVANRLEIGKSTIYKMIQNKELVLD